VASMDKCGKPRCRATASASVLLPEQAGPAKTISTLYSYPTATFGSTRFTCAWPVLWWVNALLKK